MKLHVLALVALLAASAITAPVASSLASSLDDPIEITATPSVTLSSFDAPVAIKLEMDGVPGYPAPPPANQVSFTSGAVWVQLPYGSTPTGEPVMSDGWTTQGYEPGPNGRYGILFEVDGIQNANPDFTITIGGFNATCAEGGEIDLQWDVEYANGFVSDATTAPVACDKAAPTITANGTLAYDAVASTMIGISDRIGVDLASVTGVFRRGSTDINAIATRVSPAGETKDTWWTFRVPAAAEPLGVGTYQLFVTAKDTSGAARANTTGALSFVVPDLVPPLFDPYTPPSPFQATSPAGATVSYERPTATDNMPGIGPVTCAPASPFARAVGQETVRCTVDDAAGHRGHLNFSVSVVDTLDPTFVDLADLGVREANALGGWIASYTTPTAADIATASPTVSCVPAPGDLVGLGPRAITCTATDGVGRTATGAMAVNVVDTQPPVIDARAPLNLTIPRGAETATLAYATPHANDTVDGELSNVTCSPLAGASLAEGVHTVSCEAFDGQANPATSSFVVNVVAAAADVPPELHDQDDLFYEAVDASGRNLDYPLPSVTDVDSPPPAPTCAPAPGSFFALDVPRTVTCHLADHPAVPAIDFNITVRDRTPPTLTASATLFEALAAEGDGTTVDYAVPATFDLVDGAGLAACVQPPGFFALGEHTVTCTATDARGNANATPVLLTVRVERPFALRTSGDLVAEARGSDGALVFYNVTPTGRGNATATVACAPASGALFAMGTTNVSCTGATTNGTAEAAFAVTVMDTTAPDLTDVGDIVVEADGSLGTNVTFEVPTATDVVSGVLAVTCDATSGARFPVGATTIVCSATDAANLTGSTSFTVSVLDRIAPDMPTLLDRVAEATSAGGASVVYAVPNATDVVSDQIPLSCAPSSGSVFALGVTNVTCAAADAAGNRATGTFAVTVVDSTAPAITASDVTTTQTSGCVVLSATDAVGVASIEVTLERPDGTVSPLAFHAGEGAFYEDLPLGSYVVVVRALDAAGNAVTRTIALNIVAPGSSNPSPPAPAPVVIVVQPPPAPLAAFTAPATLAVGASLELVAFRDGTNQGATFAWDFGDGATATGERVSHAWSSAGTRVIILTVTKGSQTSTAARSIAIEAAASAGAQPPSGGSSSPQGAGAAGADTGAATGEGSSGSGSGAASDAGTASDAGGAGAQPPAVLALAPTGIVASPAEVSFDTEPGAVVFWRVGAEDTWRTTLPARVSGDGPVTMEYYATARGVRSSVATAQLVLDGAAPTVLSVSPPESLVAGAPIAFDARIQDVSAVTARLVLTPTNGSAPAVLALTATATGFRSSQGVPAGEYGVALELTDAVGRETTHALPTSVRVAAGGALEESSLPAAGVENEAPGIGLLGLLGALVAVALILRGRRRHS